MINKTCLQCNKEFNTSLSAVKRGEGKHCSKYCYTLSLRNQPRLYRRKRVIKSCLACGIKFEINPCRVRQGSDKHCSKKCYGISKIGQKMSLEFSLKVKKAKVGKKNYKISGPNHYIWKGGVTPIRRALRSSFEYNHWHAKILARDYYTCQLCKTKKGPFHVDHYPKTFAQIFDENKIKTIKQGLSCEEFWKLNNGRTLCKPCHINVTYN